MRSSISDEECNEKSIEKMLVFIERLANSDGVYRRITKGNDISNTIKCNLLDKKNILDPFRVKYGWYFKNKYIQMEGPKK